MSLEIEVKPRKNDNGIVVSLSGRLDSATAGQLDACLEKEINALEPENHVVMELGRLTFISSMGIRSLLVARKNLLARGSVLQMIHAQQQVAEVLRMAHV